VARGRPSLGVGVDRLGRPPLLHQQPAEGLQPGRGVASPRLLTPGVRDREDIADRLVVLYGETGRHEEADTFAAEAKRISRSTSGVSVRRTVVLQDAGDRAVVRDTATATFDSERFPLDRLTEIVEALDAAKPSIGPRRATKVGRNDPCPCGSGRKYKKCCG